MESPNGNTQTTQTTAPTQVLQTAETPTGAAAAAGGVDAGAQTTQTTQTTQTPAAPVIPDGYVKAEEVESERTARTAAETARVEAEARASAAEARAREIEIRSVARGLNFNDPEDALALVAADSTDIEAALKGVLEKKPYLAKSAEVAPPPVTPTSPTNPARTATQAPVFTQAQISDRTFWNANRDAIMLAMREGRIQG